MDPNINVSIENVGPEIKAEVVDNHAEINVSVEGAGPPGRTPQKGVDYWLPEDIGEGLKMENGIVSVNTAKSVQEDNTLPITAAAVYETVGNIEILLGTI